MRWDWPLFEVMNFDGGELFDALMSAVSGVALWMPFYLLILALVWRKYGFKGLLLFLLSVGVAMGVSDLVAGIFKHSGPLAELWPSFPVRSRPMFTEGLKNLHVVSFDHGRYGTVSAHAATIISLALLSSLIIARRWFTVVVTVVAVAVCYSRIYLACHFPQDILLGSLVGVISAIFGYIIFRLLGKIWGVSSVK